MWERSTYLVCYYGTTRGASISGNHDTAIVESTNDGGTGGCGLRKRYASGVESEVAVVVGEVEARHLAGVM